jgi:hypothetical protein
METINAPNMEVHRELKEMHGDILVGQKQNRTKWETRIKIEMERKKLDTCPHFSRMDRCSCLIPIE